MVGFAFMAVGALFLARGLRAGTLEIVEVGSGYDASRSTEPMQFYFGVAFSCCIGCALIVYGLLVLAGVVEPPPLI